MKTILVPLDLSRTGLQVCRAACDLARQIQGRLILVPVVTPPPVVLGDIHGFESGQLAEMNVAADNSARPRRRVLDWYCARRKVPATTVHRAGVPVGAILAKAASSRAAYIVIGSHGHGAKFDLLAGCTTHGVLKNVRCPVLAVPLRPRR